MKVLLVNPEFPESYWSGRHSLDFCGRKSLLPPLGLITIAALMPHSWSVKLADLNVETLSDDEIRQADIVMLTGMLVQRTSLHNALARCRRLGVRTAVGGPYATALPSEFEGATDHLVVGEAEDIMPAFAMDLEAGRAKARYEESGKPDMFEAPTPRYDLLDVSHYHQMGLQYSRGCPFSCEFCDIIVMYGQKPRVKAAPQVLAELDAIQATGFAGDVFFVDDNFIGNKKAVRTLLPEIAAWRARSRAPLEFYTEASMNLADDMKLADLMTSAGFTAVFMGIETPSPEGLKETKKLQNLKRDMVQQVHGLLDKGIDVWAGFILGFDSDGPEIFDQMSRFIQSAAIPYAMVGMLGALPNTPLYHRLQKEGRLSGDHPGDQFGMTNVITKMPQREMLAGYKKVLETVYRPEVFFDRCKENLERWNPVPGAARPVRIRDVQNAMRAIFGQGLRSPYKKAYWQFLQWAIRHQPSKINRALAQAAAGHHYITYTRDTVLPSLKASAAGLASAPAAVHCVT